MKSSEQTSGGYRTGVLMGLMAGEGELRGPESGLEGARARG